MATINADTQLTPMVTAVWVTIGVVVPLIWLFPPLALLAGMGIYALSKKRAAPASAAESTAVAKLEASETAARSLRTHQWLLDPAWVHCPHDRPRSAK